jgi:hypothetical protein
MVDVLGLNRFESKIVHFSILFFFSKKKGGLTPCKNPKNKK